MSSLLWSLASYLYPSPTKWLPVCQDVESATNSIRGSQPFEHTFNNDMNYYLTCKAELIDYVKECDLILLNLDKTQSTRTEQFLNRIHLLPFKDSKGQDATIPFNQLSYDICSYYIDRLWDLSVDCDSYWINVMYASRTTNHYPWKAALLRIDAIKSR